VESLNSLKLTKNDTVVLDMLSNVAFMGTDDSGLPAETIQAEDGRYHVIVSLTTAPPSVIENNLAMCAPLGEHLGITGTVLISPVPRYTYNRCCDKEGHVENLTDPDFDEEIAMGLEGIKRLIHNWAVELMLDFELVDPTMLNDACDLGIKMRVTNSGSCPWEDDDPVHLSSEGYRDLAWVIRERAHAELACDGASVASSDISSNKRRAPKSVVTKPMAPPSERGRGSKPPSVAGWLVGRLDPGGDQRRGSVFVRAGHFLHRGGCHWGHRPPHRGWLPSTQGQGERWSW
jgi:hypothetical protein